MIRVLLCDDAVAFGVMMGHWLSTCEDVELMESVTTPDDAVRRAGDLQPDVIVLDHMLRAATSRELVPQLHEAAPGARVLLISALAADLLEKAANESGADAHIGKASTPGEICAAIRAVGA